MDEYMQHDVGDEFVRYLSDHNLWEVGMYDRFSFDPPRIYGVLVDATTGAITSRLDRLWDEDLDGYP